MTDIDWSQYVIPESPKSLWDSNSFESIAELTSVQEPFVLGPVGKLRKKRKYSYPPKQKKKRCLAPKNLDGSYHVYTKKERDSIIARWQEKKANADTIEKITYMARKKTADSRPRIRGRFVALTENMDARWNELRKSFNVKEATDIIVEENAEYFSKLM